MFTSEWKSVVMSKLKSVQQILPDDPARLRQVDSSPETPVCLHESGKSGQQSSVCPFSALAFQPLHL
ncbi:unnamed protein product [Taenia asiatica]|uniref:Dynein light intermediate chain n=1 Tax=Taenia asiatica TaxID=60517 RepID=A0A0R3WHF1_TAEAS|nr:unnamed protein product [Taenia asiatica]